MSSGTERVNLYAVLYEYTYYVIVLGRVVGRRDRNHGLAKRNASRP